NDVGAAAGHVRRYRHRTQSARLGDDLGLAAGVFGLGVEPFVLDAALLQQARNLLRAIDVRRADQDGPAGAVDLVDFRLRQSPRLFTFLELDRDFLVAFLLDRADDFAAVVEVD